MLWANLVAWPDAALILQHWLTGFGYHVPLNPLWFAAATSISLALTLITVSAHCYRVAREKPAKALRYERLAPARALVQAAGTDRDRLPAEWLVIWRASC